MISTQAQKRVAIGCSIAYLIAALGWCCGVAASEGVSGPAQQIDLTSEFPGNSVELPRVTGISIGFGRRFKLGCWSPVIVQVTGAGEEVRGHLEVTVLDGDGDPVVTTTDLAIHVSPGQTVQCVVYAKIGRPEARIQTVFRPVKSGNEYSQQVTRQNWNASEFGQACLSTEQLVVTLGDGAIAEEAVRAWERRTTEGVICTEIDTPDQLPTRWWGYEGVDTLIILTGSNDTLPNFESVQLEALQRWVQLGGRVILSAARNAEKWIGRDRPLADFAPGRFVGVVKQRDLTALESFAEEKRRIRDISSVQLEVVQLENLTGKIELELQAGAVVRPLIFRHAVRFGQIVFIGCDLDTEPIEKWPGRERVVSQLLDWTLLRGQDELDTGWNHSIHHAGYRDIVGQLRSGLDRFTGVSAVPFWIVVGLLIGYVTLLGPIDFFWLSYPRQWRRRAWVILVLLIASFITIGYVMAGKLKTINVLRNQVDLIDVDVASQLVRGTSWTHLYSPHTAAYDLNYSFPEQSSFNVIAGVPGWLGLPGSGLGGMNTKVGISSPWSAYHLNPWSDSVSPEPAVGSLSMVTSATKSLVTRWWGRAQGQISINLSASAEGRLRGSVGHDQQVELEDCFLYYRHWTYRLGPLQPGEQVSVNVDTTPLDARWRLTRRRRQVDQIAASPWDPASTDVPRIIEMMLLHELAGGRTYTDLLHRYQSFADLSSHLTLDYALLIGRAPKETMTIQTDQGVAMGDHVWTFYRYVIPVSNLP